MQTRLFKTAIFLILFFLPSVIWAEDNYTPKGAVLNLWKRGPPFFNRCGICAEFFRFWEPEDRWDFSEFPQYYQSGYYYLDLYGKKGVAVTLFGERSFKSGRGFLAVVKRDNEMVRIEELEKFAPDTWVEFPGQGENAGGYAAFYHPYENFRQNIASVKWGNWWGDAPPAPAPAAPPN